MNDKTTIAEVVTPLTEAELERAREMLVYRKEYNKRPRVKEARKVYNRKRAERMRMALAWLREQEGQGQGPKEGGNDVDDRGL
jgi:hypothetical protein